MPTINQLIRKPRQAPVEKKQGSRLERLPPAPGRVHPCVYHYTEKAQLCLA